MKVRPLALALGFVPLFAASSCGCPKEAPVTEKPEVTPKEGPATTMQLFDGKSLGFWEPANFAGNGGAEVTPEGALRIKAGDGMLNGVKWSRPKDLPKVNYEVALKARRVAGDDFFLCLTFPYKETHASFVAGGWGGSVCGVSSIDFMDAMENMTMSVREFDTGKWYAFRLVVSDHRLQVFVDGERIVNANVKDRKVGMRFGEIEESVPFGIATFKTTGEHKDITLRPLTEAEVAAALKLDDEDEF